MALASGGRGQGRVYTACQQHLGMHRYTPYEGPSLANHNSRKLGVFGRKLQGSHSPFYGDKAKMFEG